MVVPNQSNHRVARNGHECYPLCKHLSLELYPIGSHCVVASLNHKALSEAQEDEPILSSLRFCLRWPKARGPTLHREELLANEPGAVIDNILIIFTKFKLYQEKIKTKINALKISLWFPEGSNLKIHILESH